MTVPNKHRKPLVKYEVLMNPVRKSLHVSKPPRTPVSLFFDKIDFGKPVNKSCYYSEIRSVKYENNMIHLDISDDELIFGACSSISSTETDEEKSMSLLNFIIGFKNMDLSLIANGMIHHKQLSKNNTLIWIAFILFLIFISFFITFLPFDFFTQLLLVIPLALMGLFIIRKTIKGPAHILFNKAYKFIRNEEIDKAFDLFYTILEKYPNHIELLFNIGVIFLQFENFTKAEHCFQMIQNLHASEDYKELARRLIWLAQTKQGLDKFEQNLNNY